MAHKIVIAEDDPVLREVYIRKFTGEDFDIRVAENGEQAIKLLQEDPPEVLLLDLNMPIIDGFGVLERFPKEQRPFKIIILTNFEDQQNRRRGDEHKVDDYFVKKNMTIKSLYEMVERLVGEAQTAS